MASPNPKIKRILAWIGIILLVVMYVMTLVFALSGSEYAVQLVIASVTMTIVVPVLLYAMQLAFSVVNGKKEASAESEAEDHEEVRKEPEETREDPEET